MQKRTEEQEIEKGDYAPPIRKDFFSYDFVELKAVPLHLADESQTRNYSDTPPDHPQSVWGVSGGVSG